MGSGGEVMWVKDNGYGRGIDFSWTEFDGAVEVALNRGDPIVSDIEQDPRMFRFVGGKLIDAREEGMIYREALVEIEELKEYLARTDYMVIKAMEYGSTVEELYPEDAQQRQHARERINELEQIMEGV